MKLYGPLAEIKAGQARFSPELGRNLDAADAVYRSINRTIDAFIAKQQIAAPEQADYEPPWQPETEPTSLDLRENRVAAIVWCAGFASDFGWVKPAVLDERGFPRHERGVTEIEGLYFLGLPWLYTWGSGRFSGVGRDAAHVVNHLAATLESESDRRPVTALDIEGSEAEIAM